MYGLNFGLVTEYHYDTGYYITNNIIMYMVYLWAMFIFKLLNSVKIVFLLKYIVLYFVNVLENRLILGLPQNAITLIV